MNDLPVSPSASPRDPDEPRLTSNALEVVRKRYLARDDQGHPTETPAGMFRRVARNVAAADAQLPFEGRRDPARSEATFYRMMASLEELAGEEVLLQV